MEDTVVCLFASYGNTAAELYVSRWKMRLACGKQKSHLNATRLLVYIQLRNLQCQMHDREHFAIVMLSSAARQCELGFNTLIRDVPARPVFCLFF